MEPAQSLALANSFIGCTNYGIMMNNISVSSKRSLTLQPISLPTKIPMFKYASMADSVVAASIEGFKVLTDNLAKL